jgi:hypothetical protein
MEDNNIKLITNKERKASMFKFIIMLITVFTLEIFIRDPLRKLSTNFQLYFNYDKFNICEAFDFVSYVEHESFYLLIILLLNFTNTYATLVTIFLRCFVYYFNGILKLIYLDSRPFWVEENLKPCICTANYGNPSTSAFCQFLVYLTVYKAFTTCSKVNKCLLKVLCWIPPILVVGSRILQNAHSLNQILFGFSLAYLTYYFFFEIIQCDFNKEKQFKWMIKNIFTIFLFTLFMFVFSFVFHWSLNLSINNHWLTTITKYCEYREFSFFDMESYLKTCKIFLFLGSLFGCYVEFTFSFRNRIDSFTAYNVNSEKRFNNTNISWTLWRIAIMSVMFILIKKIVVISILHIFSHESFVFFLLFNQILPLFWDGACIFSILKFMVEFLSLTNQKAHYIIEKSETFTTKSFNSLLILSIENNIHENLI